MKKSFLVIAIAFTMSSFLSSCKKDYTCTCTDSANPTAGSFSGTYYNMTKQQAETLCVGNQTTATINCKIN